MIIGIAGTLGAGKGTVVEYLKTKGFIHYSVSGKLSEMLHAEGKEAIRENLSVLADTLADTYKGGILEVMHQQSQQDGAAHCVIESIHRVSEAEYIRSIGGYIFAIDAEPKVRYERTFARQESEKDNVTYENFLASIEREEKGNGQRYSNINQVIAAADYVFENNGTLEELQVQVANALDSIQHEQE